MNRHPTAWCATLVLSGLLILPLVEGSCGGDMSAPQPKPVANQSPNSSITAPANGATVTAGDNITFQGTGNDPEDGALSGASLVWTSSLDGQIGTGTSFSRSDLSVGVHTITLTATDSQGATGTASIQSTIQAAPNAGPNQSTTATILEPPTGAEYKAGDNVNYEGAGTDQGGGPLTGASLVWTSSLDGQIGIGESFSTNNLSLGAHTITLTATDSQGDTATATIQVSVKSELRQTPKATITAPANGSVFTEGELISFEGTVRNPDGGVFSGATMLWVSSLEGQIGTGTSFSRSDLSVGTHTITLIVPATEQFGFTYTAVKITVQPASTP